MADDKRFTSSKKENHRLVKEVVIDERGRSETVFVDHTPLSEPYQIDYLRLHYIPCPESGFPLLPPMLSPSKYVVRLPEDVIDSDPPPREWRLTSMVHVMEDRWSIICWGERLCVGLFDNIPARAVYILWTSQPCVKFQCEAERVDLRGETTLRPISEPPAGSLLLYTSPVNCAEDLAIASVLQGHPNDIIVVNAGQIEPSDLPLEDTELDDSSVQSLFKDLVLAQIAILKQQVATDDRWRAKGKSKEELEKTKFTFVSLQEYIAKYDWSGEFTEEEVDPWRESKVVEELDE
jgi:hypothetical protein